MKNKELRASEMSLLSLFFLVLEFAGAYGYNFMYSIIVSSFPSVSVFSSVTFYSFFRSLQIVFLFSVASVLWIHHFDWISMEKKHLVKERRETYLIRKICSILVFLFVLLFRLVILFKFFDFNFTSILSKLMELHTLTLFFSAIREEIVFKFVFFRFLSCQGRNRLSSAFVVSFLFLLTHLNQGYSLLSLAIVFAFQLLTLLGFCLYPSTCLPVLCHWLFNVLTIS